MLSFRFNIDTGLNENIDEASNRARERRSRKNNEEKWKSIPDNVFFLFIFVVSMLLWLFYFSFSLFMFVRELPSNLIRASGMDDGNGVGYGGACTVANGSTVTCTCRNKLYYLYDYKMLAEMMRKRGKKRHYEGLDVFDRRLLLLLRDAMLFSQWISSISRKRM